MALKHHRVVCRSNIEEGDDNETEDLDLYDEQNSEQQEADQTEVPSANGNIFDRINHVFN